MFGRCLIALTCLSLSGCRAVTADASAEARGYERGYRQAVKEQYWIIQNQQHRPKPPAAP